MAEYRTIHTRIWDDEWFMGLSPSGKVLFIYLFSNRRGSVAGIYALPFRRIVEETGLRRSVVEKLLTAFAEKHKVYYEDGVVWVKNMRRLQDTGSETVAKKMERDVKAVPDCPLKHKYLHQLDDTVSIPYADPTDTVSIPIHSGNGKCNGNGNGNSNGKGTPQPPKGVTPPNIDRGFDAFMDAYPKKTDRTAALHNWRTQRRKGGSAEDMITAAGHYAKECADREREDEFIIKANNFLSTKWDHWRDYLEEPPEHKRRKTSAWEKQLEEIESD